MLQLNIREYKISLCLQQHVYLVMLTFEFARLLRVLTELSGSVSNQATGQHWAPLVVRMGTIAWLGLSEVWTWPRPRPHDQGEGQIIESLSKYPEAGQAHGSNPEERINLYKLIRVENMICPSGTDVCLLPNSEVLTFSIEGKKMMSFIHVVHNFFEFAEPDKCLLTGLSIGSIKCVS